jgi:hypothetical protein
MDWKSWVSWPISSGIPAAAASTCSGSRDASALMAGSILFFTRSMSTYSLSTL